MNFYKIIFSYVSFLYNSFSISRNYIGFVLIFRTKYCKISFYY